MSNRWIRLISPSDIIGVVIAITAANTAVATPGTTVGTITNTSVTVITIVDTHIGIRTVDIGTGTSIVIGRIFTTTDIGGHITVPPIVGGKTGSLCVSRSPRTVCYETAL